ncbi:MAG TPA: Gfo/Idh/MocA family oxidoreductase [Steroidobacteraceae bacterium]|nr:Gfo/Idh/MocA family oxidoreductase [Steroidobacteraceae bacterium]
MQGEKLNRRDVLRSAGSIILASSVGRDVLADSRAAPGIPPLKWGFVGTGAISNHMAKHIATTPLATLTAVSSRSMASARAFADLHGITLAFDDWKDMCEADDVDGIYVATPTGVREEIAVYAARAGKHVLAEKPFASVASVQRIVAACRDSDVAFMDGTRFVHHPRTHALKRDMPANTGRPLSIASAFQFALPDRRNIRYDARLEPMGAIGDAGWYNLRATVEYLAPGTEPVSVSAVLRRDETSETVIAGAGVIQMNDGSTATWNCAYDVGGSVMDCVIAGRQGTVRVDNFLRQDPDHSATYHYFRGGSGPDAEVVRRIESNQLDGARMFDTFAAIAADASLRDEWATATLRTQRLLDASWASAFSG